MYKAVIFYFSGTGNTWWVADKIKKQLDAKNINADTVSVDSVDAKKADWWIKASDLVFFGWPVYSSDMPEPMKRFVNNLYVVEKGKHVHTFCTQMFFSGDGAWVYHKNFETKGLTIDSTQHFLMPSNISIVSGFLGPPKNEETIKKIMDKCAEHIENYVDTLLMGKARIKGKYSYPMGIIQRAPYRLFYSHLQNKLGVDKQRCTSCGLCAKLCPSNNISMNTHPEFLGKCDQCFRCYAFCPSSAITYNNKLHKTDKTGKPYMIHDSRFKPSILK